MAITTLPPGPDVPESHDELGSAGDVRVAAVTEVLGGAALRDVARRFDVDPPVLRRWVRLFTEAGAARLANQPEPSLANQRDRFLAAFAHELRTPLAVAQGWASVMADGDLPPEMATSTATKLCRALDAVVDRTREVELLAAASLGRLRVDRRPVAARRLPPVDLGAAVTGDPTLVVHTDPDLAGRVISDLWHAAELDPAPLSRRIEVSVARPWAEVRVVREGDPIDSRLLQALFDPFDLNDDDTGITTGLYLARALGVALGGAIGLEQDAHAAAFWLRIPLTTPGGPHDLQARLR